jgi:hypothetical protein
VAAEGKKSGLISVNERLERALITPSRERYEAFVALKPEQGRASAQGRNSRRVL